MRLSRSQVDKAGRLLRRMHRGDGTMTPEKYEEAMCIVTDFRASHYTPLVTANNGLRSMLRTADVDGRVTQRLKRSRTIVDKLVRQPTMALSKMQDIGGCRVVCEDIAQLRRLEERIRQVRPPRSVYDYIQQPKKGGYRALHLVVSYDERLIEIQLRTGRMHIWAVYQELVGTLLDTDLKSGVGPSEILEYMNLLSRAIALKEDSGHVETALIEQLTLARQRALPLLGRDRQIR